MLFIIFLKCEMKLVNCPSGGRKTLEKNEMICLGPQSNLSFEERRMGFFSHSSPSSISFLSVANEMLVGEYADSEEPLQQIFLVYRMVKSQCLAVILWGQHCLTTGKNQGQKSKTWVVTPLEKSLPTHPQPSACMKDKMILNLLIPLLNFLKGHEVNIWCFMWTILPLSQVHCFIVLK